MNIIDRDQIYVGEVISTNNMYAEVPNGENKKTIKVSSWYSYRSMLFVLNEKKFANDLLYQSPHYPVLNISDDDIFLDHRGDIIVIKDACSLSALLKYFNYDQTLDFDDIVKIRNVFFTGKFAKDNCQLFGYKEIRPDKLSNRRLYSLVNNGVLASEYFNVLDERGDRKYTNNSLQIRNAFKPHEDEGPIKKLTRF